MSALARAFRVLVIASAFFFFWTGSVLVAWALFPALSLLHRTPLNRRRACQRLQRRAFQLFHGYMRVFRLLRVELVRGEALPAGAFVMVANHPTLVDVTALLSQHDGVCCVVKTSLVKNPLLGPLFRACGHIDGGDGAGMSGASVVPEALARLEEGFAVLVFPEGTRSPRRGMHRFRRGAFEIAQRAGVPVVPVFLSCDPPALMKGMPFWENPDRLATLRIEELPAIATRSSRSEPAAITQREVSRDLCRAVQEDLRFRLDVRSPPAKGAELSSGARSTLSALPQPRVSSSGALAYPP